MKAAPVLAALKAHANVSQVLVHTGQHYDKAMSDVFFEQLGMPRPDHNLEVGSGSHAVQTGQTMIRFEPVLQAERPDWVLVYGDVNSTIACALVAVKLGVRVAHVEAGLRSRDRGMPEEINRILTDQISDLLLTPSADGDENLVAEGVSREKIRLVGNVMIDTLVRLLPKAARPALAGLAERFILVTLHRPSNVDDPAMLKKIMDTLGDIARDIQVVFPIHPRTRKRLADSGTVLPGNILLSEPLGYLEFLWLQQHAACVVTDSGGIQEETTYLQVPCLTLRENTERPITITHGSNKLIGMDMGRLRTELAACLSAKRTAGRIPPLWDGHASERIAAILAK